MHIVHLTPNFYPAVGGIETYVSELAERQVKKGHEVSILTSDRLRNGEKLRKFEKIGKLNVHRVPFKLVMRYNFSPEALRLILDLNYDVLHIHSIGYFTDIIPVIKNKKNVKVIVSTHGGIFHTTHMDFLKKIYFKSFTKKALKQADYVIATSKKDERLFSKICNRNKIEVICPGVDWKELSKLPGTKSTNTVLYVGRFSENKRLDKMLHVIAKAKKRIIGVKLLMVGEDWGEKRKLLLLVKKLKLNENVSFVSGIEDHYKYYSKANLFLLSSAYEGFGTSVVEAMSTGMPVIVNDIKTMHEIVSDGNDGYIVNFDKYEKVADLVVKILENRSLQKKIGASAKSSAKRFDWDLLSNKIENIYRK
ncbi:MAG: glycosyltransferase family 4 protein [Candidatus Aenigmarchaeota archaeon]|nr:glycosyltransferase family 4 protein [Candidatus Aenigmarchaeota archaeon]